MNRKIQGLKKLFKRLHYELMVELWKIVRRFRKSITISSRQGKFTVLTKDNVIGRSLFATKQYEEEMMAAFMTFLKTKGISSSSTLIDIGANNGITTISLLLAKEFKKAILLEPEDTNFSLMQHNIEQNGLSDKTLCLQYAVSDKEGKLTFELSSNNFGDHRVRAKGTLERTQEGYSESKRNVTEVDAKKLDDIMDEIPSDFKNIGMVWIDTQGHEGYVYAGAKKLFATGIPVVSEVWPYGIKRSGMTEKEYYKQVKEIWKSYWVLRRGKFVQYPIEAFPFFMKEFPGIYDYDNVIFSVDRVELT